MGGDGGVLGRGSCNWKMEKISEKVVREEGWSLRVVSLL